MSGPMDKLREALEEIVAVASGERQVAVDDTEGMEWIDKRARQALAEAALHQQTKHTHEMNLFPHIKTTGRWCLACTESGVAQAASLVQRITNYLADNDSLTDVKISDLLRDCRTSLASQQTPAVGEARQAAFEEVRVMLDEQRKECLKSIELSQRHSHLNAIRADEIDNALINLRMLASQPDTPPTPREGTTGPRDNPTGT